jgi:hypothetical protein
LRERSAIAKSNKVRNDPATSAFSDAIAHWNTFCSGPSRRSTTRHWPRIGTRFEREFGSEPDIPRECRAASGRWLGPPMPCSMYKAKLGIISSALP